VLTWLTPLFALTALIYASVGFAGGSTYTALLVLAGVGLPLLPIISLACNIIVSTGGTIHFARARAIPWLRCLPIIALSVPLAWYGGSLDIDKALFVPLLAASLGVAGLLLLIGSRPVTERASLRYSHAIAIAIAAPLGFLSGVVGIGGGIFLAPILHLIGWDSERRVAGAAALFILVNSIAGIVGQAGKLTAPVLGQLVSDWWPLLVAVFVGGQIGSLFGSRHLPLPLIRRVTGAVVLVAAARLVFA
jgi:uncharacterized protein